MANPDMTIERAAGLLAAATPGTWHVSEMRDGAQFGEELAITALDDKRSYRKPDGTWHAVIIARGLDGPTRRPNAELLAAAPELARAYLIEAGATSALREILAVAERALRFVEKRQETREAFAGVRARGCDLETYDRLEEQAATFTDYGGMLAERRRDAAWGPSDTAEACGLTGDELAAVEQSKRPPFNEATTRKLCAFLGCDPGPLLAAAAKCEEALRG